jgi:hypothetical protein
MAELKTQPTDADVEEFIASVPNPRRRDDCRAVVELMREVTGQEPVMWGPRMIGFGRYRYRYATGREGDWPLAAVSPGARALSIHIMAGFSEYGDLLDRLGPHRAGVSCLYVTNLSKVDAAVLREMVARSVADVAARYGDG